MCYKPVLYLKQLNASQYSALLYQGRSIYADFRRHCLVPHSHSTRRRYRNTVYLINASAYRSIGRYRCSTHRKSLTRSNITRYLLYTCVYFRLRTAHCLCKLGFRVDVRVSVSCRSGVLATSFKDAIDLLKTVYFLQPVVQPAGRIVLNIHKINKRMNE